MGPSSADIEAYEPPYLFRGVRPEIVGISATDLARGDELSFEIFPETRITSIIFIRDPCDHALGRCRYSSAIGPPRDPEASFRSGDTAERS